MNTLLTEYQGKVAQIRNEVIQHRTQIAQGQQGQQGLQNQQAYQQVQIQVANLQYAHSKNTFHQFDAAVQNFIRVISQHIDKSNMDITIRVELQLRLADFERELNNSRNVIRGI